MRTARLGAALAALLIAFGVQIPSFALASEEVRFNSAGVPPTPFKIKQAMKKGIELKPEPGIPLTGRLSKPEGAGPFPAVVLFHGCFGIRPYQDTWAANLAEWGYVALQVDWLGPRNVEETCTNADAFWQGVGGNNVVDAYGALAYLRSQPFVDAARIAIMGWGDNPTLSSIVRKGEQEYFEDKYVAAIALYPNCQGFTGGDFYAPVLILIGESDDWTLADHCKRMAASTRENAFPVRLLVYPNTYHGFDDADLGESQHYDEAFNQHKNPARGATLGYNVAAHENTQVRVRDFLAKHLN